MKKMLHNVRYRQAGINFVSSNYLLRGNLLFLCIIFSIIVFIYCICQRLRYKSTTGYILFLSNTIYTVFDKLSLKLLITVDCQTPPIFRNPNERTPPDYRNSVDNIALLCLLNSFVLVYFRSPTLQPCSVFMFYCIGTSMEQ